jgi:hypothetical protein
LQEKEMKSLSIRSRSGIGLLILLVLVCSSVVWAGDAVPQSRCSVTDQASAYPGQTQITLKSSNNTFTVTGAGNGAGEYTCIHNTKSRQIKHALRLEF